MMTGQKTNREINVIILAGGSGKRFWPMSSEMLPKQFLPVLGKDPLIIQTFRRLLGAPFDIKKVFVLTNRRHRDWFSSHPFFKSPPFDTSFVFEPFAKNTAPPITWVSHIICNSQRVPAPCLVLSSDHWISPVAEFQNQVAMLYDEISEISFPGIYVFGVPPTSPSTDYGYIECKTTDRPTLSVLRFKEKPDKNTALSYLKSGRFFWNAGIFFFDPQSLLDLVAKHLPILAKNLSRNTGEKDLETFFEKSPSISIDHGILEHTLHRRCVKASFRWSDIGTWQGLWQLQKVAPQSCGFFRTPHGDQKDNVVITDQNQPVILLGCENLYVVNFGGKLLIAHKDHLHKLGPMVDELPPQIST